MYRRRRQPAREPAFSFDSFLDVVTNVVGIIVRLILVAWVGARAYGMLQAGADETPAAPLAEPKPADDPMHPEVARTELALAEARKQLLARMQELREMEGKKAQTGEAIAALAELIDDKFGEGK